jgi:glyoxylase-like metal-dependent hydrolase (beta-lactamase superfamily II)
MKQILGNSYYFPSQVVIGGYKVDNQLLLIDSGNDDSSVRKAYRDFGDIQIIGVLNTHSHADHCGGNAFIQNRFSAPIYAPSIEHAFIEAPILEPTYLYGAYPLQTLQNKFLMAKPSSVTHIITEEKPISINFDGDTHLFEPIALKGHSPNQFGYRTPDDILYLGDALIGSEIVAKHPLIFTYDVTEHLNSLDKLKSLSARGYVIAHGGYVEEIETIIVSNYNALMETQAIIHDLVANASCTFDALHQNLSEKYDLIENVSQNLLNRSVIHAHVKRLVDNGDLEITVDTGKLMLHKL